MGKFLPSRARPLALTGRSVGVVTLAFRTPLWRSAHPSIPKLCKHRPASKVRVLDTTRTRERLGHVVHYHRYIEYPVYMENEAQSHSPCRSSQTMHEVSVHPLLRPHLDLVQPLALRTSVLLLRRDLSPGREFLQRGQAKTFAPMARAVAGSIIVDDVSEGYEARPVDVVDPVDEDEDQCDERKREPQQEVVEQGVVCGEGQLTEIRWKGQAEVIPEVRGRVKPAQIMNSEKNRMYGGCQQT